MTASGEMEVSAVVTHQLSVVDVLKACELATSKDDGVIKVAIEMPCYRVSASRRGQVRNRESNTIDGGGPRG